MTWRATSRVAVFVGLVAALAAQDLKQYVREDRGTPLCTVQMLRTDGASRAGGLGYVLVDVVSNDGRPHRVQVVNQTNQQADPVFDCRRVIDVGPGEQVRVVMPAPCGSAAGWTQVLIDGEQYRDWHGRTSGAPAALIVTDRTDKTTQSAALAQEVLQGVAGSSSVSVARRPADLPPDWPLISGFDLVLVDGTSRIEPPQQELLRRYAAAGGRLVIGRGDRLPAGPLATLVAAGDGRTRVGLGDVVVVADLRPAFAEPVRATFPFGLDPGSGMAPAGATAILQIPGVGQPPVKGFLLVILAFAVLVGPVNMAWLRRRRKPLLALVTVPALGFGTTALILGYGFFHDGFGIQGVQRTFTVLDQRVHEASAIAQRTMFAGLSPDVIELPPGTLVSARRLIYREDGNLDGGSLPSRTPVTLATSWQGTARQRLRFRAVGDDRLEVLADGELQPAPGTDMLVRLHDGAWFLGSGGALVRADEGQVESVLRRLRDRLHELPLDPDLERSEWSTTPQHHDSMLHFVRRQLGDGVEPGSFLCFSTAAPWVAGHGLDVDWHHSQHWVLGRFGEEDVVR